MATVFPQFPKDPESQMHLLALGSLSHSISLRGNVSETLNMTRAFLFILSDAPYHHDYVYFRLHEGLVDDYAKLKDHYNHYIFSQGQEYMLKVINKEIGDFGDYFNDFQFILNNIDKRSKHDPAYAPLNTLLWGLYCAMYDQKKLKDYLNKALQILIDLQLKEKQVMSN
jgi:hypothetical protein